MTTTTPTATLVQRYLAAWNATDPAERRAAVEAVFAPNARYVDPLADVTGTDALDALIAGAQEQFPGMRFTPVGEVDAHHDVCRFQWGLGPEGAEPLVIGFDVAMVDADGRITGVVGFLDKVPTA
ncbi:nuclear transport factor 2 family protein [Pseudonocardia cypriaca]|uniref:SnoaL-like protein n=1 Tax=Pseudonocardia cypriaca TaxID=882449 RepID=A0A543GAB7_9PSEU|nr:nuclear transport factor 2 family protein [Pseudonocardia cypriaca]TQM43022.1 SnoaL-like protein [Pseudonocardia cypriaca]